MLDLVREKADDRDAGLTKGLRPRVPEGPRTSDTPTAAPAQRFEDEGGSRLPIDRLYTRSWSLGQAVEAYEWFDEQADGKGVFEF